jgi:peptidoglycan-associated lipoprotein
MKLRQCLMVGMAIILAFSNPACKKKGLQEDLLDPSLAADTAVVALQELEVDSALVSAEALFAVQEEARLAEEARLQAIAIARVEEMNQALSSLDPVYFSFDKANLDEVARLQLSAHVQVLQDYSDVSLRLAGHCDENGSADYNLALGDRRSLVVRDYFAAAGLDPARFSTLSYGKSYPVALGHKEADWKLNRRCEFKVLLP